MDEREGRIPGDDAPAEQRGGADEDEGRRDERAPCSPSHGQSLHTHQSLDRNGIAGSAAETGDGGATCAKPWPRHDRRGLIPLPVEQSRFGHQAGCAGGEWAHFQHTGLEGGMALKRAEKDAQMEQHPMC